MKKQLHKLILCFLLVGSGFHAKAQFFFRIGWPTNFTTVTREIYDAGKWTPEGDYKRDFNTSNPDLTRSVLEREYIGGSWSNYYSYQYKYKPGKTMPDSLMVLYFTSPTQAAPVGYWKMQYNAANNQTVINYFSNKSGTWKLTTRELFFYDIAGTRLDSLRGEKLSSNGTWDVTDIIIVSHNNNGTIDRVTDKADYENDGTFEPAFHRNFNYNAAGELSEIIIEELATDNNWYPVRRFRFNSKNGINETVQKPVKDLQVYPNPCNDLLKVTLPEENSVLNMEVYNMTGQKVLDHGKSPGLNGKSMIELNISLLPAGAYILRCSDNTKVYTKVIHKM